MTNHISITHALLAVIAGFVFSKYIEHRTQMSKLAGIPTLGPSGFFSSYISAFKFVYNARDIIQDGYKKHYGHAFKVPLLDHWLVVVCGPKMVEDIRKATDDQLSSAEAFAEVRCLALSNPNASSEL
ncbi:hypothetical protein PM082_007973 [Marasmius tenuissimus]|nr:hypothetical protein PM082_007973 [Marasmius tenuissimus]